MNPHCHLCSVEVDKQNCDEWLQVFRRSKKTKNEYDKHYYCDTICFMDDILKHESFKGLFVRTSDGYITSALDMYCEVRSKHGD